MNKPSHQDIECRAYQLWENRGQPWGTPETDWFHAEQELSSLEADAESPLTRVAREVGGALGSVIAFLTDSPTQTQS